MKKKFQIREYMYQWDSLGEDSFRDPIKLIHRKKKKGNLTQSV
jgi:hypothetical protein